MTLWRVPQVPLQGELVALPELSLVISILWLPGDEIAVAFWLSGNEIAVAFWLASNEVAVAFWLASNEIAGALRAGILCSTRRLGESGCCGQKTGGNECKLKCVHRSSPFATERPVSLFCSFPYGLVIRVFEAFCTYGPERCRLHPVPI